MMEAFHIELTETELIERIASWDDVVMQIVGGDYNGWRVEDFGWANADGTAVFVSFARRREQTDG